MTAGSEVDPMDELCTCGHVLGVHHTLDEACCEDGCECCAFQGVNPEFGNGQPSEAQLQAQLDAHSQQIAENVRDLTADLPGGEGRIGEIKDELDQILDAAQLCTDSNCGHRRDLHISKLDGDGCNAPGCECPAFLEPSDPSPDAIRRASRPTFLGAAWTGTRNSSTHSNTREAADRSHADVAYELDAEPMSPTESMTDEEREESDAVQAETLANLCTCGHPYGIHAAVDDACLDMGCACAEFEAVADQVLARVARELADDPTYLPERVRPTDAQVERVLGDNPFRNTLCLKCGHEANDHAANGTVCHVKGCECEALVEYTGGIDHEKLERDRRLPYTPPLLRKKYIGEDELRKVLIDAGRLDLLQQLPQVDRVTTNYGVEHWQRIERLARSPQGSSEANTASERTITAIAIALLDLRQSLDATIDNAHMLDIIQQNTVAIQETVKALDRIVGRVPGEYT